jgi:hypothetical protein
VNLGSPDDREKCTGRKEKSRSSDDPSITSIQIQKYMTLCVSTIDLQNPLPHKSIKGKKR